MSTSLSATFNKNFGNLYFVSLTSLILDPKIQFPESSQKSISEKSIFGQFEVIFLNV